MYRIAKHPLITLDMIPAVGKLIIDILPLSGLEWFSSTHRSTQQRQILHIRLKVSYGDLMVSAGE